MNRYNYFLEHFAGQLPLGESFDIIERKFYIGKRKGRMYFTDALTDGQKCQLLLNFLLGISEEKMNMITCSDDFMCQVFPFLDSSSTEDIDKAVKQLYSGLVVLLIDGFDKIIIADARDYPSRSVEEPSKEKTLRGAKDGFTENFMENLGLIRRRIRDNRLIIRNFSIGEKSKTDVAMCYFKGFADMTLVNRMEIALNNIVTDSISISDQSVVEELMKQIYKRKHLGLFNPFPKVRYTQRPDIIAAHITEGKIAIVIDNTPTVLLLPVSIFDFAQDVDDYYFPLVTGNYLRLLRILNMFVILLLTPIYLLMTEGFITVPFSIDFFIPTDPYAIPILWQFILLEIAIDGLKLASLNTPDSLGMSLSVIGALILGEFSIDSGWFIPQTILVMAVVALASFTQPSIELSYGIKFMRIILLVSGYFFGVWGLAGGLIFGFCLTASTKTLSGDSYLYPLVPFNFSELKKLLFRTSK